MIRKTFVFVLLCPVVLAFGQKKQKLVSISISNNGLLSKRIDQIYYPRTWNYGDYNSSSLNLKFDLRGDFQISDKIYLNAKFGYGLSKSNFDNRYLALPGIADGIVKQNYKELSIGFQYHVAYDKLEFAIGFGIPFFFISTMEETIKYASQNPWSKIKFKYPGGYAAGLSSYIGFRFFLNENLFLRTDLGIAALYSKLGGKRRTVQYFTDPSQSPAETSNDWPVSKEFEITRQDFSFGVGLKF
jgi:hypothetical protein